MNILFIGNTGSSATNFKKGLLKYKDISRVDVMFDSNECTSGKADTSFLKPKDYDVVIYSYPFLKTYFKYVKYALEAKAIFHWRGTDLRGLDFKNPIKNKLYKLIHSAFRKFLLIHKHYHIYSTPDLGWWFRNSTQKNEYIPTPIDTDKFNITNTNNRTKHYVFKSGARGYKKNKIKHEDMPGFLNTLKSAEVYPAFNIHPKIMSNLCAECLACGVKVKWHEDKDRAWVLNNRSIPICSEKLHQIILKVVRN